MGFLRPYFMANFEAFDGTFRLAQTSYLLKSAPLLHAQSYHPIFHGFANIVHILFCSVQIKKKTSRLSKLHHLMIRYLVKQHEISRKTTIEKPLGQGGKKFLNAEPISAKYLCTGYNKVQLIVLFLKPNLLHVNQILNPQISL